MHYYKRNIGDYHRKAGRLSMLEHGAYTLLMDSCYDREVFPTKSEAIDWCWARTDCEIQAVKFVLGKFFTEKEGIYTQKGIEERLAKYKGNCDINQRIAIERERERKDVKERLSTEHKRTVHEPPPNQEPLTKNQEPLTKNQEQTINNSAKQNYNDEDLRFAEWMYSEIIKTQPEFKKPKFQTWAKGISLMVRIDKRNHKDMGIVWKWARTDNFYPGILGSAVKFRKHYDALVFKMGKLNSITVKANEANNRSRKSESISEKVEREGEEWLANRQAERRPNEKPVEQNDKYICSPMDIEIRNDPARGVDAYIEGDYRTDDG